MRRDLAYFYERPINEVFAAFEQAANQRFGKDCKTEPCVRLTFGLNFSMKYNMNGGSVTAHFMPYQNGTAVNLRYSIVQAFGARYKAHAHDLTLFVNGILRVTGQPIQLDVDRFLDYEAGVPSVAPAQASPALQQTAGVTCPRCGTGCAAGELFCSSCGTPLQQPERPAFCTNCGASLRQEGKFCHRCGAKI
ncbi:MAG: zinc ribbon domain-containing protein [Ruminococcus sp.]|nr:zinc ribbon domain-containing protein [Ruminococcus sp.]MBQ1975024.1 zinc ribbon domain-containing protein [Ruminococcus sp.]MBQ2473818.1 zinc ribbon domain-containing protein [Ruminococcus sp.]MBQ5628388.1 zinc ribbon domain-containing protein [Ruminococcus sp.]